jgi:hypothetical protein
MSKVVLEAEIKSNIKSVSKETKDLTNNFGAFGITIGSIKEKFNDLGKIMLNGLTQIKLQAQLAGVGFKQMFSGQIIRGAKNLFTAIRVGVAATGVGALVIAFTSLVTFLTKTKKGAELLEVAMAGLGAALSVITDRASKLGGAIVSLFKGDTKAALEGVKGTFSGIGDEIVEDTKKIMALKRAFQALRDSNRELNVETAEQRAEIERLKLIAEDVTKSTQERLAAAKEAFKIENDLLDRRIANAKEALRIQREEMKTATNMDDALDREAQLRIDLANIQQESTTKQIELNNKINAIEAEAQAKRDAAFEKEKAQNIERTKDLTLMPAIVAKVNNELIQADNDYFAQLEINQTKKKQLEKDLQAFRKDATMQGLQLIQQAAGEGTAIGKAAAIAQATITGTQGVINAFTAANQNFALTAATAGGYPIVMAGLAAGFAATNIAKIAAGSPPSASGGGGGGGAGQMVPQTPAPQMMSGAFELGGGLAPEPMKAFVVTDEMTNSQDQLANIRRQATI